MTPASKRHSFRNELWVHNLKFTLQDILCPPKCIICERTLPVGENICKNCSDRLPYIGDVFCMKCGKPINSDSEEYCSDCMKRKHYFERNISLWTYSPNLKKSIYKFKYSNKKYYGKYFVDEIVKRYGDIIRKWDIDGIIAVPMYKGKLLQRGYNQAEILALELGRRLGITVYRNIVKRIVNTIPMKQLNDKERQKNIKGSFKVTSNVIKLKKVLLVDDIFTTGCTADEISKELKKSGVHCIYLVTLCVGRGY